MWCHLCSQDYPTYEEFRNHLEKHKKPNFSREDLYNESIHEDTETSEIEDENVTLNTSEGNCYESDYSLDTEIKPDTSMYKNNTVPLHTYSRKLRKINSEIKLDESMDGDNTTCGKYGNLDPTIATKNKSKLSKAAFQTFPEENINTEIKSDESMNADNMMPGKCNDSDYAIAAKNNSNVSKTASGILSVKNHDDEAETPVIKKNTVLKKRRKRCNTENKATTSNRSPKKKKTAPTLKKHGIKKQMKGSFSKKALPKHTFSSLSREEDISGHSDDHSESSFNGNNTVNPHFVPNNFGNPSSVLPVNIGPGSQNNNPVYIYNPYGGQGIVLLNQAVQPPVYVVNTLAPPISSNSLNGSDFDSEYILNWLTVFKNLCKNMEYPLSSSLFSKVKALYEEIFDQYCTLSKREETPAVFKVYEQLDCIIHKHVNSLNMH